MIDENLPETKPAAEPRGIPPVLAISEHINNLCIITSGLIISPQNPVGTIGDDALIIYHKVIDAYLADPSLPQPTQT